MNRLGQRALLGASLAGLSVIVICLAGFGFLESDKAGGPDRVCNERVSEHPRVTPLPNIVMEPLREHFGTTQSNQSDDLVFGHPVDGAELNASALNERFKEAVVASGIRPTERRRYKKRNGDYEMRDYVALSFHDCRHAWASWCLSNGQAQANVQKWGGWEDAKTMAIYDHFIPSGFEVDQLNAAVERETAGLV